MKRESWRPVYGATPSGRIRVVLSARRRARAQSEPGTARRAVALAEQAARRTSPVSRLGSSDGTFRRDGAADRDGNGDYDRRTRTLLRSARAWGSIPPKMFLSCKTTRTTIFLPIWAVFRRGFDKTPLRAAQGAQVPNGTKGAQYRVCLERAVEHTTSTLDSRLKLQRSAWGAGNSARRKYSPRARSFRILDALDSAHARRERPDQAIFRRSLV